MFEGLNRFLSAKTIEVYLGIVWQILSLVILVAGLWLLLTQATKLITL